MRFARLRAGADAAGGALDGLLARVLASGKWTPVSCRCRRRNRPASPHARRAVPVIRYRRAADRRSRVHRWRDAVAELLALQAEYGAWLDALPETLLNGATGEALQAIVDLDIDDLLAIDPPRGYGRD